MWAQSIAADLGEFRTYQMIKHSKRNVVMNLHIIKIRITMMFFADLIVDKDKNWYRKTVIGVEIFCYQDSLFNFCSMSFLKQGWKCESDIPKDDRKENCLDFETERITHPSIHPSIILAYKEIGPVNPGVTVFFQSAVISSGALVHTV